MDKGHSSINKRYYSYKNPVSKKSEKKNKCSTQWGESKFSPLDYSGLTDNLNSKLLKHKHCKLEIYTVDGYKIKGKTVHVGKDFVDIKHADGDIVTVMKDKIVWIDWLSHNCKFYCEKKKCHIHKYDKKDSTNDCRCRKHHKKGYHDEHDWCKHHKKECHDDHKWWKHDKKDYHDEYDWWKHHEKYYHDDHKWWKHNKKECHDDFEWWKHHEKHEHDDHDWWKHHMDESSMW